MDTIILNRLLMLTNEIKRNSNLSVTFSLETKEDKLNAEVVAKTLKKLLERFNEDLNNYFRLVEHPSTDEVSHMSEIQLEAEQNLVELEVKLKLQDKANNSSSNGVISCRLPKINLPEFEGDILSWHQFWDQFRSNIDSRNIADVDKLLYLKASMKGDAKEAIEGFDITEKNYQIAIKTIKERYGSSMHLIDAHYAALSGVKPAEKPVSSCRATLNSVERHLRVLESLKEDVNHNHLRHLIFEKFPEDLIYELKLRTTSTSINDIRKHLELIITAREDANRIVNERKLKTEYTVESLHTTQEERKLHNFSTPYRHNNMVVTKFNTWNSSQKNGFPLKRKHDNGEDHSGYSEGRTEGPMERRRDSMCVFCKGEHFNDQCTEYSNIDERKQRLYNHCFGCLQEGHSINRCRSRKICIHCNKYGHNRALCPVKFFQNQKRYGDRGSHNDNNRI